MNNRYKNITSGLILAGLIFIGTSCEPELDDLSLVQGEDLISGEAVDTSNAVDAEIVDPLDATYTGTPVVVVGDAVTVDGGDFEPVDGSNSGGYVFWRFSDNGGYSNNPYASTSTGSDGGRGAKWDDGHSRNLTNTGDMRVAYQAFDVTPGAQYTLEFDARVDTAGDYIEALILDGHYATPELAIASTPLSDASTTDTSGAFVTVSHTFTANASGQIAIMLSAFIANTTDGASVYLDNLTLSPGEGGAVVTPVIIGEAVTVEGKDFEPFDGSNSGGYVFWRWTDREDYSNNPYASTSTGSDGGRGAKYDAGHSRNNTTSLGDVRTAYQALTVTAGAEYTISFDARVDTAGDYIEVLILDGHFDTPTLAIASTPLLDASTTDTSGAFVTVSQTFTANATGEVSIMISAFIADITSGASVYLDNLDVTPVQL